jgi:hypothetical protein
MSTQTQAMLLELLISGFFAVACFKARAAREPGALAMSPRDFLKLTDRLDRLSRTRYQWIAMVAILLLVRLQVGVPLQVELTAAAEFILFLALPVGKKEKGLPTASEEKRVSRAEPSAKSLRRKGTGAGRQRRAAMASARH